MAPKTISASSPAQVKRPRRRFRWWLVPLWLLFALLTVLLAALLYLRTSLPQLGGTVTLPGLSAPATVVRDENAVPHIYADSAEDALFALGFVHAQDRLFQMDFQRRVGAGRLSEVLGNATLDTDRFLRTLGVYRVAEETLPQLNAQTRGALEAYAAGVNAFLAQRKGALPPEFVVLGYAPEPWQPADSLVWLKMMAWDLSGNWSDELLRARLLQVLPPERVAELWPPYPGDAPVALPDFSALYRHLPLDALAAVSPEPLPPGSGSNNWVVNGKRSVTGAPLLANDPHLALQTPALWYFAQLSAPGLNVTGATLPGLPLVVLGHTGGVAWGFTNTGPDTQDLFVERLDARGRYQTPQGWQQLTTRQETIAVKGQDPVTLSVRETRHGPLISDVNAAAAAVAGAEVARSSGPSYALAFAWTALRRDDRSMQAGLELNRAQNWIDFTEALRNFHAPQQNIVYADTAGNIGFYAPARVPIRKNGDGQVPVPGWTGAYDWQGFIPFDALPHAYNPPSGQIVTANNKLVPDSYPYLLTKDWSEPYRAELITALLGTQSKHSLGSFRDVQSDQRSLMANVFLPFLLGVPVGDANAKALQERLAGWDGEMAAAAPEPLIFSAWYRAFTRLVLHDELGALFADTWEFRPLFFHNVISRQGRQQGRWCDDTRTPDREACEALAAAALGQAWDELSAVYGDDPERWRWGEPHYAEHDHLVFGQTPLAPFFNLHLPNGGDPFTVNAASYALGDDGAAQTAGPGYRALYDLADLDRSRFMQPTGQSGNTFSPHYSDFLQRWVGVDYLQIATAQLKARENALGTLTLLPKP